MIFILKGMIGFIAIISAIIVLAAITLGLGYIPYTAQHNKKTMFKMFGWIWCICSWCAFLWAIAYTLENDILLFFVTINVWGIMAFFANISAIAGDIENKKEKI